MAPRPTFIITLKDLAERHFGRVWEWVVDSCTEEFRCLEDDITLVEKEDGGVIVHINGEPKACVIIKRKVSSNRGRMAMTSDTIAARVIPWEPPDVWGLAVELRDGKSIAHEVGGRAITELERQRLERGERPVSGPLIGRDL